MKIKEQELRKIVREAISELGDTYNGQSGVNEGDLKQNSVGAEFRKGAQWMAEQIRHDILESFNGWKSLKSKGFEEVSIDDMLDVLKGLYKSTKQYLS